MLQALNDGWWSFAEGRRWRCAAPGWFCEIDEPGNIPSHFRAPGIAAKIARIRSFYMGRLAYGPLDRLGTGLDILVANALTESYGTVPSPFDRHRLEAQLQEHIERPLPERLGQLVQRLSDDAMGKSLIRREPRYVDPVTTPARLSVGAHHMLISTAQGLPSQRRRGQRPEDLANQVVELASDSLHSARLAIEYLNGALRHHQLHLPLIAASYNAGSLRATRSNPWHLVQYGGHIDRWLAYYNASREALGAKRPALPAPLPVPRDPAVPPGIPAPRSADDRLSAHFTLLQMIDSPTARSKGIDNHPGGAVRANLQRIAELLEKVRHLLGERDLHINSAYRCPELNRAVGSKPSSRHVQGLAADFTCSAYGSPLEVTLAIAASGIVFDQVIHEFGRWVHIGLEMPGAAPRRQLLTIDRTGTRTGLHRV